MNLTAYNNFCEGLAHSTCVVQWGGAHVWKIGGKVYAIGGWQDDEDALFVTFKVTPIAFEVLKDEPGLRPAPYLAPRGMKWIQRTSDKTLSDKDLEGYLKTSYEIVSAGLTRKKQRELGLLSD